MPSQSSLSPLQIELIAQVAKDAAVAELIVKQLHRYSHTIAGEDDDEMWKLDEILRNSDISVRDGKFRNERL